MPMMNHGMIDAKLLPIVGAIAGDIIGSVYEWERIKTKNFPLFQEECSFTDDTVMTIAVADALISGTDIGGTMRDWGKRYPYKGYGGMFARWLTSSDPQPYHSYGNGAAMRASAAGCTRSTIEETLAEAERTALPTHDHPEGIKGAQATAVAIFLARTGRSKEEIKNEIEIRFHYDLNRTLDQIRPSYQFSETCQETVPEAIIAFLESTDVEDAIRNAVSLGGDSDTLACITGGIAAAYYREISPTIVDEVVKRLPGDMKEVLEKFSLKTHEL